MAKGGTRPGKESIYDEDICREICVQLACGRSLLSIINEDLAQAEAEGREKRYPGYSTLMLWLVDGEHPEWERMYFNAKQASGHADTDRLSEIVNKLENGALGAKEASQMISALTWMAERKASKHYNLKRQMELTGADGGPVEGNLTINFKPVGNKRGSD